MHRTAPALVVAGLSAALVLAPATAASAHNYVVASTPAEGETLTAVPEYFVITTNENMLDVSGEGNGFAIQVTDADGLYYGDGCVTVQGPSMSTVGALGAAGDYTLTYQYVSADGHTLSDAFGFSYAPADAPTGQDGRAEPPVCGEAEIEPSPEPSPSDTPAETPEPVESGDAEPGDADEAGAVLGIAVVSGVVGGAIAGLVVWLLRRRRRQGAPGGSPAE